jgi:signal transduction histidine kinase
MSDHESGYPDDEEEYGNPDLRWGEEPEEGKPSPLERRDEAPAKPTPPPSGLEGIEFPENLTVPREGMPHEELMRKIDKETLIKNIKQGVLGKEDGETDPSKLKCRALYEAINSFLAIWVFHPHLSPALISKAPTRLRDVVNGLLSGDMGDDVPDNVREIRAGQNAAYAKEIDAMSNALSRLENEEILSVMELLSLEQGETIRAALKEARYTTYSAKRPKNPIASMAKRLRELERRPLDTNSEQLLVKPATFSPAEALRKALGRCNEELSKWRNLMETGRVKIEISEGLPEKLLGPEGEIAKAIFEVLKNACEEVRFLDGEVAVRAVTEGERVVIQIQDNGGGFKDGMTAERAVEPYQTSKASPALGLGLPLVKQNVEKHRGTFAIKEQDHGMLVTISFPIPEAAELETPLVEKGRNRERIYKILHVLRTASGSDFPLIVDALEANAERIERERPPEEVMKRSLPRFISEAHSITGTKEDGQTIKNPSSYSLREVVETVVRLASYQCPRGVRVNDPGPLPEGIDQLPGFIGRVEQLLLILLLDAANAVQSGRREVSISFAERDSMIHIQIYNKREGRPDQLITDPIVPTDTGAFVTNQGNDILRASIIAKSHGGSMWVERFEAGYLAVIKLPTTRPTEPGLTQADMPE